MVLTIEAACQAPEPQRNSPKEVVEQLWSMATAGELLMPTGWRKACRLFVNPCPESPSKDIRVVSNYYGVDRPSIQDATARLIVWYQEVGRIDPTLRFNPAPTPSAPKTPYPYTLVLASTHSKMFAADGKTVVKEITGPGVEWQITDSQSGPWTTVNTAIRYVLEKRNETADPIIRKNAESTIAALLHYR